MIGIMNSPIDPRDWEVEDFKRTQAGMMGMALKWASQLKDANERVMKLLAILKSKDRRIKELEDALRPFAVAYGETQDYPERVPVFTTDQLREAARAIVVAQAKEAFAPPPPDPVNQDDFTVQLRSGETLMEAMQRQQRQLANQDPSRFQYYPQQYLPNLSNLFGKLKKGVV